MKRILILVILIAFSVNAQRTNLDSETINVSYIKLPTNPVLDENKRTYTLTVNSTEQAENAFPSKLILENIKLYGFERVLVNGTIDIQIQIGDIIINEVLYKESNIVKKDKKGTVISSQKFYQPVIKYQAGASYYIRDHTGKRIKYPDSKKVVKKASKYKSKSAAVAYIKDNLTALKMGFNKQFIKTIANSVNDIINDNYGYVPLRNIRTHLWILDSKKHPENEGHKNALIKTKEIFDTMKTDKPLSRIKEDIQEVITYFESVIPKYTEPKKTKHKKMRYATYFNLATIYYYLDMPDKVIEYADKLIENKYDKYDGKRLRKLGEELKKRLQINELTSRHFKVITTDNTKQVAIASLVQTPIVKEIPLIDRYDTFLTFNGTLEESNVLTKSTLKILKYVFFATGGYIRSYPFEAAYIVDESGKITGQNFIAPNAAYAYKNITLNWEGSKLVSASIDGMGITLYWSQGALIRVKIDGYSNFDFSLRYGSNNKPIHLVTNGKKNSYKRDYYMLSYKNNRIIKSICYSHTIFRKYVFRVKKITYDDVHDKVSVNIIQYKQGRPSEPKYETRNVTESITKLSDNEVLVDYKWNTFGESTSSHFTFNKKGVHSRYVLVSLPSNSKMIFDYIYEGDEKVKSIIVTSLNGEFTDRIIRNYNDFKRKPGDTEDYQWRRGKYTFDKNEELINEQREMKYRKKVNGIWSQWRYIPH